MLCLGHNRVVSFIKNHLAVVGARHVAYILPSNVCSQAYTLWPPQAAAVTHNDHLLSEVTSF
jgi:hypothetical protein